MNNMLKTALRATSLRLLTAPTKNCKRNLVSVATKSYGTSKFRFSYELAKHGCVGARNYSSHSKAETELVEFLTEEILAECKANKTRKVPNEVDGFKAKMDGAEVTLTKQVGEETINIHFNVNHTVDTDQEPELDPKMDKPDVGELVSKPNFTVELIRGNITVSLVCTFVSPDDAQEEGYNDVFGIDEISIWEGEYNDNVYAVSGEVVDAYLHDLLLNYLDEKGITNEFAEKLSQYSTAYEHSAYISLLEGLSKFASKK